jgi:hypothetical protein
MIQPEDFPREAEEGEVRYDFGKNNHYDLPKATE